MCHACPRPWETVGLSQKRHGGCLPAARGCKALLADLAGALPDLCGWCDGEVGSVLPTTTCVVGGWVGWGSELDARRGASRSVLLLEAHAGERVHRAACPAQGGGGLSWRERAGARGVEGAREARGLALPTREKKRKKKTDHAETLSLLRRLAPARLARRRRRGRPPAQWRVGRGGRGSTTTTLAHTLPNTTPAPAPAHLRLQHGPQPAGRVRRGRPRVRGVSSPPLSLSALACTTRSFS